LKIMPIFFDSNILIYAFSNAADHQAKRRLALELLGRTDWSLSGQVLQEFVSNIVKLRHGLTAAQAAAAVESIVAHRPVCPVDAALVLLALEIQARYRVSYWDAAILAAARRMSCGLLFTEDLNHGQDYGGVVAINPFLI
jgi:predicted nucleic acid-binding protein